MEIQEVFDNFIRSRQLADLSQKTLTDYQQFIQPFVSAVGADRDILTLRQDDIENYIAVLLKRPLSKATRATYIRNLKIFLCWSARKYPVSYDVKEIHVPKTPKREVRIYSIDEVRQIFDSVTCESEWLEYRNRLILALMYDSGLRQAEICLLRRKWLSVSEKRARVHGKGDKERVVPLGNLTLEYLRYYLAACPYDSEYLFVSRRGTPLTCDSVKHMVYKLADKLDFELSSHKLRHNFATNYCIDQYEANGQVDIFRLMYLMGHEDVETTSRYLHLAMEILAARNHISHLDKVAL